MTQRNALTFSTITGILAESTPGTHAGSTPVRIRTVRGQPLLKKATRERVGVPSESPFRLDNPAHVDGKDAVEWQLSVHLSGVASGDRLVSGGATTERSHDVLLKHLFGRRYAAVGTTVSGSSSTTTSVDLTSATGRKVGELILIGHHVRRITAISSNTVTVSPALPSGPADTTVVRGSRGFYLANRRTATLSIDQKLVNTEDSATHEERVLGAFGTLAWQFGAQGTLATIQASGKGISYAGPGALSAPSWGLGQSPADDDMDAPLAWTPTAFIDGSAVTIEPGSFKITHPGNAQEIGGSGTRSGIAGFMDTSGRDSDASVQVEFTVRLDEDWPSTTFDGGPGTLFHLLVTCDPELGDGSPTTLAAWEFPRLQMIERPVKGDMNGRAVYTVKAHALRDTLTPASATTAEDRDMAWAPMRFALI